jgi:hypothetical protein
MAVPALLPSGGIPGRALLLAPSRVRYHPQVRRRDPCFGNDVVNRRLHALCIVLGKQTQVFVSDLDLGPYTLILHKNKSIEKRLRAQERAAREHLFRCLSKQGQT